MANGAIKWSKLQKSNLYVISSQIEIFHNNGLKNLIRINKRETKVKLGKFNKLFDADWLREISKIRNRKKFQSLYMVFFLFRKFKFDSFLASL